jgi:hypothetical protein
MDLAQTSKAWGAGAAVGVEASEDSGESADERMPFQSTNEGDPNTLPEGRVWK